MCTLAWGCSGESLWACFNRDEQRARPPAEPPEIHLEQGRALVYARDPDGGGTWFTASGQGFAVALLNHYPGGRRSTISGGKSRGQLVLALGRCAGPEMVREQLEGTDLSPFPPFCLFVLAPGKVSAWSWDSRRLAPMDWDLPFWTTSSFAPAKVAGWRKQWWISQTSGKDPGLAKASRLMQLGQPDRPAFGLTMDREDARSLSQIQLLIEPGRVTFAYRKRDPSGSGYLPPVELTVPS